MQLPGDVLTSRFRVIQLITEMALRGPDVVTA